MFTMKRFGFAANCVALVCGSLLASAGIGRSKPGEGQAISAKSNHSAGPARTELAQKIRLEGVPNFGEVTLTIYRGGQPTPAGFRNLAERGIAIDVDLRDDGSRAGEKKEVEKAGMEYVSLPWNCHNPSDDVVARFLTLVRENTSKEIFVHCRYGVDRTGVMIAAYRIAEQGWTPEQAREEMEAFGFHFVHRMWCRKLLAYERNFPERFSTDPVFQPLRPATQAPGP